MKTLLSLLILSVPLAAPAMPSPGSYRTGIIQRVDPQTRQLVFQEDGGRTHTLVYTTEARFWHGAADISPAALRSGMHVKVRLHHPLIGPEFVRDISLLGIASSR